MRFLGKFLLGLFFYRKIPNSGIAQIPFWLQKKMEMLLLYNGFGTFRNIPSHKTAEGCGDSSGGHKSDEGPGSVEQHVLKINLSEEKAKKFIR